MIWVPFVPPGLRKAPFVGDVFPPLFGPRSSSRHHQGMDRQPAEGENGIGHRGPVATWSGGHVANKNYPLVMTVTVCELENGTFSSLIYLKMAIIHSYVSLPEGKIWLKWLDKQSDSITKNGVIICKMESLIHNTITLWTAKTIHGNTWPNKPCWEKKYFTTNKPCGRVTWTWNNMESSWAKNGSWDVQGTMWLY